MRRALCLAFALAAALAVPARAAIFAVPQNLAPWGLTDELPADQRGIYADLAEELAKVGPVPLEIRFVPYGRMLQELKSGSADYAFGVIGPATLAAGPFVTTVATVPMVAVARKGLPLHTLADLHAFKEVGYLRGGSCGPGVDADADIHRTPQDSYESAIRKLAAGRLDGWCSIKAGFSYTLDHLGMAAEIGDQIDYGQVHIGLQATTARADDPATRQLAAAMDKLVNAGVSGRVFARYLGTAYQP